MELQEVSDLQNKGYYVAILFGAECKNLNTFIDNVAKLFHFPSYYGRNINAFLECINDLDWMPESNYALVVVDSELFMANDTKDNKLYVIDLLRKVSTEWANVPNYQGEEQFRDKADFKVIYK